jgi:hypothetical protein
LHCSTTPPVSPAALAEPAPSGKLRARINLGNGALVLNSRAAIRQVRMV